jgi:uncharacterized protein YeaO (DUF488 family)
MKVEEKILSRFEFLISTVNSLIENRTILGGYNKEVFSTSTFDNISVPEPKIETVQKEKCIQWATSSSHLIRKIFGEDSDHYQNFKINLSKIGENNNYQHIANSLSVLESAKDDYKNGYLFDTHILIEAEVFDDFLGQAEELFKKGYYQPSAVIAGCVLEDGLRKLGQRKIPSFPTDKTIDPMNVELAKAGIYNALWQKKITALADLRNKAAHGKWTEFTEKDVEDMIRDVRRFMKDYFS